MDPQVWKDIRARIKLHARKFKRLPRTEYPDWLIALMACWHTAHDRPMYWACRRENYPRWMRIKKLPSPSQFSRRVATPRCRRIFERVHLDLAGTAAPGLSYFDGKPLTVGVASKDLDAKRGHVMGGFAKGYKLHVWATEDRRIPVFCVESLNRGEPLVAQAMARQLPEFSHRALVLADSAYDSAALYNALAIKNAALLVRPRGYATHRVTLSQSGPFRREMLDVWKKNRALAEMVYKGRIGVEGILSSLTCGAEGLGPLPAWIRTLPRVRRWVGIKIILYHARLIHQRRGF